MREISVLALRQLEAWEHLARHWSLYDESGYARCPFDDMAVYRSEDDSGSPYTWTEPQILAAKVAHLRNHHAELDPCEDIK